MLPSLEFIHGFLGHDLIHIAARTHDSKSVFKGTELYNSYEAKFAEVGVEIIYLTPTAGISSTMLREKNGK